MAYVQVYAGTMPEWETYRGEGESGIAEWEGDFTIDSMVQAQVEKIAEHGGTLLSLRIWRDGDQWITESVVHGSPFLPFGAIFAGIVTVIKLLLPLVTIILAVWGVVHVLSGIESIIYGPPPVWNPETGKYEYREGGIAGQIVKIVLIGGVVVVGVIVARGWMRKTAR